MYARSGMSKDTASGPEDITFREMMQELPTEVLQVTTACCKVQISWMMRCAKLLGSHATGVGEETGCQGVEGYSRVQN